MEILSTGLNQVILWMFVGLLLAAAWWDFTSFTIPNSFSLGIAVLFPGYVVTTTAPVDWNAALVIAGVILVIGFVMFTRNWIGGGDVKLLAATALWAGPELVAPFIVLTAVIGGVISMFLLLRLQYGWIIGFPLPESSRSVPYGVAVSCGGLFVASRLLSI
jgi:prepilin peptidase CpaA